MRRLVIMGVAGMLAAQLGATVRAEPGGCLKYGAAGAVGGHVANHHAVLGAATGCVVGMYRRHEYRKEARAKAKLYDQEHPGAKGSYEQKATAYDVEHSTTPGAMQPSGTPNAPGTPNTPPTQPEGSQSGERL
ncbi:MAG: hypothetical protein ABF535_06755 [Acetobacter sp.]